MRSHLRQLLFESYDTDANAAFNRAEAAGASSSGRHKGAVSRMVRGLKDHGIWSRLDGGWFLGGPDAAGSYQNLRSSTFTLTPQGTITHAAFRGFTSNGSTGYLDTGYQPGVTAGTVAGQDDFCMGVFSFTSSSSNSLIEIGNTNNFLKMRDGSGNFNIRSMAGAGDNVGTPATSLGLGCIQRTSSTAIEAFRNGVSIGTASRTSATPVSVNLIIGAWNNAGTPANFSTRQLGFAFAGRALSAQQHLALYGLVQAALRDVGAPA